MVLTLLSMTAMAQQPDAAVPVRDILIASSNSIRRTLVPYQRFRLIHATPDEYLVLVTNDEGGTDIASVPKVDRLTNPTARTVGRHIEIQSGVNAVLGQGAVPLLKDHEYDIVASNRSDLAVLYRVDQWCCTVTVSRTLCAVRPGSDRAHSPLQDATNTVPAAITHAREFMLHEISTGKHDGPYTLSNGTSRIRDDFVVAIDPDGAAYTSAMVNGIRRRWGPYAVTNGAVLRLNKTEVRVIAGRAMRDLQAEIAKQQELRRRAEEAEAERKRQAEIAKQQELRRRAEEAEAERKRQAEIAKQQELRRRAEEAEAEKQRQEWMAKQPGQERSVNPADARSEAAGAKTRGASQWASVKEQLDGPPVGSTGIYRSPFGREPCSQPLPAGFRGTVWGDGVDEVLRKMGDHVQFSSKQTKQAPYYLDGSIDGKLSVTFKISDTDGLYEVSVREDLFGRPPADFVQALIEQYGRAPAQNVWSRANKTYVLWFDARTLIMYEAEVRANPTMFHNWVWLKDRSAFNDEWRSHLIKFLAWTLPELGCIPFSSPTYGQMPSPTDGLKWGVTRENAERAWRRRVKALNKDWGQLTMESEKMQDGTTVVRVTSDEERWYIFDEELRLVACHAEPWPEESLTLSSLVSLLGEAKPSPHEPLMPAGWTVESAVEWRPSDGIAVQYAAIRHATGTKHYVTFGVSSFLARCDVLSGRFRKDRETLRF